MGLLSYRHGQCGALGGVEWKWVGLAVTRELAAKGDLVGVERDGRDCDWYAFLSFSSRLFSFVLSFTFLMRSYRLFFYLFSFLPLQDGDGPVVITGLNQG